ncbi:MAG: hypothetical protein CVV64_14150 [Candidatus Wallbacteria bacterium HGW-Wallbacteria-1]|jgi:Zn-finger nucleic acid-binding protein|uniref:Transcription factor zinc-finger domain-containing protein n=1 Tax=Candidatus Wallbacteria bacterium HGW-Wallbacteria-1 TaxID=2013854 RepID=A0A2N1PMI7_9BACT|nr:MAG: hypothetical protein CVV64_14150 [Candidatus Wallbacteria bacterium HGW-Wallbacteria-1]
MAEISMLNCPFCGNANQIRESWFSPTPSPDSLSSQFCVNCGKMMKERLCPRCSQNLDARDLLGVEIDLCSKCGGIWFDKGEISRISMRSGFENSDILEQLKKRAPAHVTEVDRTASCSWESGGSKPNCPACSGQLDIIVYEGVEIDICPKCRGVWLDNGEFADILNRFRTGVFTGKGNLSKKQLHMASELLSADFLQDTLARAAQRRRKRIADEEFSHLRQSSMKAAIRADKDDSGNPKMKNRVARGDMGHIHNDGVDNLVMGMSVVDAGLSGSDLLSAISDTAVDGVEIIAEETVWCVVECIFEYLAEVIFEAIN